MRTTLKLSAVFAAVGLLVLLAFEFLTFERPPSGGSTVWEESLAIHAGVVVTVSVAGFIGALLGFWRSAFRGAVTTRTAAVLGGLYVVAAPVVTLPLVPIVGVVVSALVALGLAALVAWGGARAFSKRAA